MNPRPAFRELNPVLRHSLRGVRRSDRLVSKGARWQLPVVIILAASYTVLLLKTWAGAERPLEADGFAVVTMLELVFLALLVPTMAASAVAGERHRGTLELLLTTPLSNRQIVWGKLWTVWISTAVTLAAIVPFHAALAPVGQSRFAWSWWLALVLPSVVVLSAVGLYFSQRCSTLLAARAAAVTTIWLLFGGVLAAEAAIGSLYGSEVIWSAVFNPLIAAPALIADHTDVMTAFLAHVCPWLLWVTALMLLAACVATFDATVRYRAERRH